MSDQLRDAAEGDAPQAMNETQLLSGSQLLAPCIDDAFLERGDWQPMALAFARSAVALRDAMWRHHISANPQAKDPA